MVSKRFAQQSKRRDRGARGGDSRFFLVPIAIVAVAMALGCYLGFHSQGGGIRPLEGFFAPLLGHWSFLYEPNAKSLGKWRTVHWLLACGPVIIFLAALRLHRRRRRPGPGLLAAVLYILATVSWVLVGLARVAHSMA